MYRIDTITAAYLCDLVPIAYLVVADTAGYSRFVVGRFDA